MNQTRIKKLLLALFVFCFICIALLFINTVKYKKIILDEKQTLMADSTYIWAIDLAGVEQKRDSGIGYGYYGTGEQWITIRGWAAKKQEQITIFDTKVLLKADDEEKYYELSTEMRNREDLKEMDGVSYEHGGFCAMIPVYALKKGKEYRVYLWYCNNEDNVLIETDRVIERG